jgi:hypothetical protein
VAELTRRVTPHVTVLSVAELDAAGVPRPVPRIVSAPGESDRLAPG